MSARDAELLELVAEFDGVTGQPGSAEEFLKTRVQEEIQKLEYRQAGMLGFFQGRQKIARKIDNIKANGLPVWVKKTALKSQLSIFRRGGATRRASFSATTTSSKPTTPQTLVPSAQPAAATTKPTAAPSAVRQSENPPLAWLYEDVYSTAELEKLADSAERAGNPEQADAAIDAECAKRLWQDGLTWPGADTAALTKLHGAQKQATGLDRFTRTQQQQKLDESVQAYRRHLEAKTKAAAQAEKEKAELEARHQAKLAALKAKSPTTTLQTTASTAEVTPLMSAQPQPKPQAAEPISMPDEELKRLGKAVYGEKTIEQWEQDAQFRGHKVSERIERNLYMDCLGQFIPGFPLKKHALQVGEPKSPHGMTRYEFGQNLKKLEAALKSK